jgi:hypothetical protein
MRAAPDSKKFYPVLRAELEKRGIGPTAIIATSVIQHGGDFVVALASAALHADPLNLATLKAAWPLYWEKYEMRGIALEQAERSPDAH